MQSLFIESFAKSNFMWFWITGIIFAISLILANFALFADVAPLGVINHQAAGTAVQHPRELEGGQSTWFCKISYDCRLFLYSDLFYGCFFRGLLMLGDENVTIRRLGLIVILGALMLGFDVFRFWLSWDYTRSYPVI